MAIRTLSLCSGYEGIGLGLKLALGDAIRTVCYVEREAYCASLIVQRIKEEILSDAPIWSDLKTFDAKPWRGKVDLITGGYPCFAAGTLVLTLGGYRPIEEIKAGDVVLTHLGRWRKVTAVMAREKAKLRRVDAQGVPGVITTDEHPFWGRTVTNRKFNDPKWIPAKNLTRGDFLSQVLPPEHYHSWSESVWWVVGRYLADGWRQSAPSQYGKGRVLICCARHEAKELRERLIDAGFAPSQNEERTTSRFSITRQWFYDSLEPFGHLAHGKTLPGFALMLDPAKSKALLDGYLSGDGFTESNGCRRVSSVSKSLALGIALLAQRAYGVVASIRYYEPSKRKLIEGREVNQRPRWVVDTPLRNRSAFIEGGYGWKRVRGSKPAGRGTVYNIAVDEDESYVADGAIVHNCQPFSVAGKRGGDTDPRHLWPFIKEHIREIQPAACFFENVAGHLSLGFDLVRNDLKDLGYEVAAGLFTAEEVGASHKRERLFILAVSKAQLAHWSGTAGDGRSEHSDGGSELAHDQGLGRGEELGGTQGEPGHLAFKGAGMADPAGQHDNERPEHEGHGRSGSPEQAGVGGRKLADAAGSGRDGRTSPSGDDGERDAGEGGQGERDKGGDQLGGPGEGMAHTHDQGPQERTGLPEHNGQELQAFERSGFPLFAPGPEELELWGRILQDYPELEPAVRGVADGTPFRVDRIRALGNGVVPDVAAFAFVILLHSLALRT